MGKDFMETHLNENQRIGTVGWNQHKYTSRDGKVQALSEE